MVILAIEVAAFLFLAYVAYFAVACLWALIQSIWFSLRH